MPLTATRIVATALATAKCPGYTAQGGEALNAVLADLCMHRNLKKNLVTGSIVVPANSNGPFNLELTYLRTLTGRDIAERSLKEMRRSADLSLAQAQRWLAALLDVMPDVKATDRLTGLHIPGVGARFWHNSQPRASVPDPEFSRLFFGIWLSQSTSEPQLRRGLLARLSP